MPDDPSALAERLRPVQDMLAQLEREQLEAARAGNEPGDWATWADLSAALMAVRGAQSRAARTPGPPTDHEAK